MGIIYKEELYKIVGAYFEVYNELGNRFDEPIYHESLMKEFSFQSLPAQSEPQVDVFYKGEKLVKYFKPDMVAYSKIIVELKAVKALNEFHRQQVLN
ncbi:MAG: GxxExxY protein [Cryomorphaceae bacterium]|jgi:GxxExxY protein